METMEIEMNGYESKCEEIVKELKNMAGFKHVEFDSGFTNPVVAASYNIRVFQNY